MFSEIIDIVTNILSLPDKKVSSKSSINNTIITICYLITISAFSFLIPEIKRFFNNDDSLIEFSFTILFSILISLVLVYFVRKYEWIKEMKISLIILLLMTFTSILSLIFLKMII